MRLLSKFLALCRIPPVIFDGFLCVTLAMAVELENDLSKDDAYKYWNVYVLYFVKLLVAVYSAGGSALIFFRSKSYSEHRKAQDAKNAILNGNVNQTVTTQTTETKTNETQISNPVVPPANP